MKFFKFALSLLLSVLILQSCEKEYSVETGGKKLPAGNWEFKDSTSEYMGTIDSAVISKSGNSKQLSIFGKSLAGDETFQLSLYADTFVTGKYKASLFQATMKYNKGSQLLYDAGQTNGEFTVSITTINDNLVTGVFSGLARDSAFKQKNLFEGKFKATWPQKTGENVSVGVLGATSGNCDDVAIAGEYRKGTPLGAANTVTIDVTVANPGTYNIYTDAVNGVTFSKTGTFTSTGAQKIVLTGSGTPAFAGEQTFPVYYGNTKCAFKITFVEGAGPSNDYYPLKNNNTWIFKNTTDSLQQKVLNTTTTINGKVYTDVALYQYPLTNTADTVRIRKEGGNYYSYQDYGREMMFDEPVYGEEIILKDNVAAGTTWNSNVINGKIGGIAMSFSIKYTLLQKAVAAKVGTFDFTDVMKVKSEVIVAGLVVSSQETWFARNVGPVYLQADGETYSVSSYLIL